MLLQPIDELLDNEAGFREVLHEKLESEDDVFYLQQIVAFRALLDELESTVQVIRLAHVLNLVINRWDVDVSVVQFLQLNPVIPVLRVRALHVAGVVAQRRGGLRHL